MPERCSLARVRFAALARALAGSAPVRATQDLRRAAPAGTVRTLPVQWRPAQGTIVQKTVDTGRPSHGSPTWGAKLKFLDLALSDYFHCRISDVCSGTAPFDSDPSLDSNHSALAHHACQLPDGRP